MQESPILAQANMCARTFANGNLVNCVSCVNLPLSSWGITLLANTLVCAERSMRNILTVSVQFTNILFWLLCKSTTTLISIKNWSIKRFDLSFFHIRMLKIERNRVNIIPTCLYLNEGWWFEWWSNILRQYLFILGCARYPS